jgi:Xaa-Pro aminopeptidase
LAVAIGEVHPEVVRGAEVAEAAYAAGVAAMRQGVSTFGELDAAMTSVVADAGGYNSTPNVHTLPHVGVGSMGPREDQEWTKPYRDLSERSRNPTGGADMKLEAGMVFAMQPNCVFGRRRVNVGGTVIATSTGIEELNELPLKLLYADR